MQIWSLFKYPSRPLIETFALWFHNFSSHPYPKISEVPNISNTFTNHKNFRCLLCISYIQIQSEIVLFVHAVSPKVCHKSQKSPKIFYELLFKLWAKFCSICSISDAGKSKKIMG